MKQKHSRFKNCFYRAAKWAEPSVLPFPEKTQKAFYAAALIFTGCCAIGLLFFHVMGYTAETGLLSLPPDRLLLSRLRRNPGHPRADARTCAVRPADAPLCGLHRFYDVLIFIHLHSALCISRTFISPAQAEAAVFLRRHRADPDQLDSEKHSDLSRVLVLIPAAVLRPAVSFTPAGRQDPPVRRCPETPGRSAAKSPAYTRSKFHNLSSEPPGPGRI